MRASRSIVATASVTAAGEGVDIYVDELDYDLLDGCRVIVC